MGSCATRGIRNCGPSTCWPSRNTGRWRSPRPNPLFNFLYAATATGESYTDAFRKSDLTPLRRHAAALPGDRIPWGSRHSHRPDVVMLPAYGGGSSGTLRGARVNGKVMPVDERYVIHWNHDPWR